jgi:hypothetical protein
MLVRISGIDIREQGIGIRKKGEGNSLSARPTLGKPVGWGLGSI